MATANKTTVAASAAILLLLFAAAAVAPASASTITVYPRTGCGGSGRTWGCGQCHNLDDHKEGYIFRYSGGQVGRFYRGWSCEGSHDSVRDDVRRCSSHGYNSVHIIC